MCTPRPLHTLGNSLTAAKLTAAETNRDQHRAFPEGEDGNILVLAMGYVLVIVLAVLLTATLSGLHLERKRLLALADAAALVATDYVSGQTYLAALGPVNQQTSGPTLDQSVADFLSLSPAAQQFTGLQVLEVGQNGTGQVTVSLTSKRSFLASFNLAGPNAFTAHLKATGIATSVQSTG